MGTQPGVEIDGLLDTAKLRAIHWLTLIVCTVAMMIDGYDLYVVGWVLPDISHAFHVSPTALKPILFVQQLGMLVSLLFVAPLADKVGRRNLLIICLIGTGLCSFASAFSTSVLQFGFWRVVTGLFASAVVPNLVTHCSEVAPRRVRATFGTIVVCGAQGGTQIGAAMQAFLLPQYGWSSAMLLGAALSAVIVPVVILWMPESPRFMVRRNANDPRLPRLLTQLDPTIAPGTAVYAASAAQLVVGTRERLAAVLGNGQRLKTILLWFAFIASFTFIGHWSSWGTTVFKEQLHLDWKTVAFLTSLHSLMGVIGACTIGFVIDRFGFRAVLPTTYALSFLAAIGAGYFAPGLAMYFFLGAMGLFQISSQAGLATMAPTLYPPSYKATAVGWAYAAGRIGSIAAPFTGAALVDLHEGPLETFVGLALPLVFASVLILLLTRKPDRPPTVALTGA
jgi:MFS transporter, AAHS family, 4-hydroxybenzoate transporter